VATVPASDPAASGALARSQAARRRRVLDATLGLAAEGGFDAVQMRDVAAAADVALGTVYRYFSSKERLLLEAMAEQQADLRSYLHSHPPMEATGADRVLAVLARSNRALRGYPDVTAAMVRAFGSAANENADIVRKVTEIMTDIITGAIQGTERHEPTDREVRVARILMQVWLSSLNGWVCGVDPPERVVDTALDLVADALSSGQVNGPGLGRAGAERDFAEHPPFGHGRTDAPAGNFRGEHDAAFGGCFGPTARRLVSRRRGQHDDVPAALTEHR
jgi:AcrR family transcriptional regulator